MKNRSGNKDKIEKIEKWKLPKKKETKGIKGTYVNSKEVFKYYIGIFFKLFSEKDYFQWQIE